MSLAVNTIPTPYIHVVVKRRKNTWYSVKDGNWSDPLTWESNAIRRWKYPGQNIPSPTFPQVGDDVYIGHTVTLDMGSLAIPIVVNNLYVSGTLNNDSLNRYIVINGDLQASGTIDLTTSIGIMSITLFGVNNYIVNFISGTNSTVTYARNGDQAIMDLSYQNLSLLNTNGSNITGTKYLVNNLSIAGNLNFNTTVFELSSYNLTVNGTTTSQSQVTLSKIGAGSILFVGLVTMRDGGTNTINFSGNPTVEFRGGLILQILNNSTFNSGTGAWSFATNNQNLQLFFQIFDFTCPIIVGSGVNLTFQSTGGGSLNVDQYLEGTDGTSTFTNQGRLILKNATYPIPMTLNGVFVYNVASTSYVEYAFNGSYTLPYTSYQNLGIAGTGTKTLLGDTTLLNALYVGGVTGTNGYGILELSTFNFTVNGTTNLTGGASSGNQPTLSKNSSTGLILLIGALLSQINNQTFDFSGNPNIELRGGGTVFGSWSTCNMGTGTLSFTTNNQNFDFGNSASKAVLSCNILISGAITVIFTNNRTVTVTGTVNGDNSSSILDNRAATHYQNATAPMVTGLLYCNQATNTWYYDLAGNQDIQPPSDPTSPGYSNLTLAGSGAKRLLGNVSVKRTYTLTSPATLDSNGFTLSNP